MKKKLIILILIAGAFLRFYDLDWGDGYFFHPDEYHIAISVNQLSFPHQMHPHFFSYGTFISYLIYFSKELGYTIGLIPAHINPTLIGRFYSALFSSATIFVVFLLTKKVAKKQSAAIAAAAVTAFTPGLIQQAHYATPESLLIFWVLLSLLTIIKWIETDKKKYILISAISFGAALSIKMSGLIFLPVLWVAILLKDGTKLSSLSNKITYSALFLLISFLTFFLIYPYSILDGDGFRHSMNYETGVGRGDPVVFYTRQFIDTTPIIFQATKILPFVIDPASLIMGITGVFFAIYKIFKDKNKNVIILLTAFILFFISSSFLFAKWTRFIIPGVPFFAIFSGYFLDKLSNEKVYKTASTTIVLFALLWSLMFFQIYLKPDVRIQADRWLMDNIAEQSYILTEAGNMIEVPITGGLIKNSFDFYHLDENPTLQEQLIEKLEQADYFIVQSRRIYSNHQRFPDRFVVTSEFYDNLFNGNLGFEHIKTFSSFPTIPGTDIKIVDEFAEETWTVFDHPVVRIYEKTEDKTAEEYREMLRI